MYYDLKITWDSPSEEVTLIDHSCSWESYIAIKRGRFQSTQLWLQGRSHAPRGSVTVMWWLRLRFTMYPDLVRSNRRLEEFTLETETDHVDWQDFPSTKNYGNTIVKRSDRSCCYGSPFACVCYGRLSMPSLQHSLLSEAVGHIPRRICD